ncbi:hypothetical protein QMK19_33490 [Streptomyces sp. H10-C2]|nr:hypothetical protein [Streptomyces sp. PH10-H1]MDJ0374410.1 hypothetical protein [Streptomyces sp. H10-C2]
MVTEAVEDFVPSMAALVRVFAARGLPTVSAIEQHRVVDRGS